MQFASGIFSGDPRRPYPTDFEMRHGFLGKAGDIPAGGHMLQSQGSYGEPMSSNRSSANTSMGKSCRHFYYSHSHNKSFNMPCGKSCRH